MGLNEIRLSQDQDKVPAVKGIAKRRIRQEGQVVEEVAAQIQTKDNSETNRLLYATAIVVTERLGVKPGKKKETKEPWWKRRLRGQVGGSCGTISAGWSISVEMSAVGRNQESVARRKPVQNRNLGGRS